LKIVTNDNNMNKFSSWQTLRSNYTDMVTTEVEKNLGIRMWQGLIHSWSSKPLIILSVNSSGILLLMCLMLISW